MADTETGPGERYIFDSETVYRMAAIDDVSDRTAVGTRWLKDTGHPDWLIVDMLDCAQQLRDGENKNG